MSRLVRFPAVVAALALAAAAALALAAERISAAPQSIETGSALDPLTPGPDLPPIGRSLFDYLVSGGGEPGKPVYQVPFPFPALVEQIHARLGQQELFGGTRIALVPMGRSLQRTAAAPDYFKYPRVVLAVTGDAATNPGNAGVLLKDRLYIGYVEKTGTLEVISYNEAAGRFEFELVKDYRQGGSPRVVYANRAICTACHQNHAPIFSKAIWSETNANGRIAGLLRAHGAGMGLTAQANIDFPDDIEKSVARANALAGFQAVWQQGCFGVDPDLSRRCRAAALIAVLQYGLTGERDFAADSAEFQLDFVATLGRAWQQRWPRGLSIAEYSLPDRNPFGGGEGVYGGAPTAEAAPDWLAASNVAAALDPLNLRPPRESWRFAGGLDAPRLVAGWSRFFARDDFRRLDAQLRALSAAGAVEHATQSVRCNAHRSSARAAWTLECAGGNAPRSSIRLSAAFDERGSGRFEWIALDGSGRLQNIELNGRPARTGSDEHVLRGAPKLQQGLTPRFPDGRALSSVELRWSGAGTAPGDGAEVAVTLVVADDFAGARRAVHRLLDREPALFDAAPIARERLLRPLFAELGLPALTWCCASDRELPPAQVEVPGAHPDAVAQPELQPFFRACALCHLSAERFPPNFLAGSARSVVDTLRRCAPRMLVRLAAWETPEALRVKSPMPPPAAVTVRGVAARDWAADPDFARMQAYLEALLAQEGRAVGPRSELPEGGYEALPSCLAQ